METGQRILSCGNCPLLPWKNGPRPMTAASLGLHSRAQSGVFISSDPKPAGHGRKPYHPSAGPRTHQENAGAHQGHTLGCFATRRCLCFCANLQRGVYRKKGYPWAHGCQVLTWMFYGYRAIPCLLLVFLQIPSKMWFPLLTQTRLDMSDIRTSRSFRSPSRSPKKRLAVRPRSPAASPSPPPFPRPRLPRRFADFFSTQLAPLRSAAAGAAAAQQASESGARTAGPLDRWTTGPLDRWTAGPLDRWTAGPLDPVGSFLLSTSRSFESTRLSHLEIPEA